MKKTLVFLFTVLSLSVCKAEPPINLHLPKHSSLDEMVTLGTAMAISGALLCTGIILEGSESYSSAWKRSSSGYLYRDEQSFFYQTPRQIFFAVGATVSLTGIVTVVRNIRGR